MRGESIVRCTAAYNWKWYVRLWRDENGLGIATVSSSASYVSAGAASRNCIAALDHVGTKCISQVAYTHDTRRTSSQEISRNLQLLWSSRGSPLWRRAVRSLCISNIVHHRVSKKRRRSCIIFKLGQVSHSEQILIILMHRILKNFTSEDYKLVHLGDLNCNVDTVSCETQTFFIWSKSDWHCQASKPRPEVCHVTCNKLHFTL